MKAHHRILSERHKVGKTEFCRCRANPFAKERRNSLPSPIRISKRSFAGKLPAIL